MDTTYLNFSWVIDGTLAGCARPLFAKDLTFIASQGIRAIVRLATKEELALERDEVTAAGLDDCHEPVRVLMVPSTLFTRMSAAVRRPRALLDGLLPPPLSPSVPHRDICLFEAIPRR
jgi:hypothetical protein